MLLVEKIFGLIDWATLAREAHVGHMALSNAIPADNVEDVAEVAAHAVHDFAPPIQMWFGLSIGIHVHEVTTYLRRRRGRPRHEGASCHQLLAVPPMAKETKACLTTTYWVHNSIVPAETDG